MKEKEGISLVALIITIIALIILTGAVIITMNQGNTIEKSEEAVFKSDLTNFRDQLVMKILDKQAKMEITGKGDAILNNVTGNNLRTWVPSITDKYIGKLAIKEGNLYYKDTTNEQEFGWAIEINMVDISSTLVGQVKVGDYIEYTPPGEGSYTVEKILSGTTGAAYEQWCSDYGKTPVGVETFELTEPTDEKEKTWRVLSVEGANVTIMRGEPTADLTLWGQAGYDNAEEVLNEICGIYKNETYANSARSITIEDINKVTGYMPIESENPSEGEYGSIGYSGNQCTYYSYIGRNYILDTSSNEYIMIFNNNANSANKDYWIASRCVNAYSGIAYLGVRYVHNGCVEANSLRNVYASGSVENSYSRGACPVVVLKSTVSVADGSGTVGDPWKIQ